MLHVVANHMGAMIAVVGASGVGKDTVMSYAARRLVGQDNVEFVRRVITRAADAGGEAHLAVSRERFDELAASGAFAVHWLAHGHGYGLPLSTMDSLRAGRCLIANGSRAALPAFVAAYPRLHVLMITASQDCLLSRLSARGRESVEEIKARLARPEPPMPASLTIHTVDNSGDPEVAGEAVLALIRQIAALD
ncbi:phosphonate metabolism protein/1,5-bisphosphokinase (PRPP-forming) PhnN [Oryzibacter oryziterrae]|uniref:phosphonate metabolism protein/1,5-bisphosphokinase (PRPP-forming) PhnN n=1 Tax=Oryzibacter oryziterrae TaxID=2766474 RepID=UPI001F0262AC|nr:phosphonate metabolism protein/1,5-bisphosphokinase (PRPP-forming) PhnN [Oryzibacter oryziterrae]